jgi:hypothetical protein
MTMLRPLAVLLAFALLLGPPIAAAPAARTLDLHMALYLAGVKVGALRVSIDQDQDDAVSRFDLESRGLAAMLTGYQGWAEARTRMPAGGRPQSIAYDSFYETNRYNRKVEIRYGERDGEILDLKTWKRGKPQRSKVPPELWVDTVDPLTALLTVRAWLLAARAGDAAAPNLEVFDGGRRYSLRPEILGREQVERGGRAVPVWRLALRLIPRAGFSKNDLLANWASEGGERWIEVLMTDDDEPVPLSIRTHGGRLASTVELEKRCLGGADCVSFGS